MSHATYFDSVDVARLLQEFPLGDRFVAEFTGVGQAS